MFDVIGSIVISLSRCCLPNDEGPGPEIFFPRTAPAINMIQRKRSWYTTVAYPICRSVGLSARKMHCDKLTDWISMPFGMVSGVGRGMGRCNR